MTLLAATQHAALIMDQDTDHGDIARDLLALAGIEGVELVTDAKAVLARLDAGDAPGLLVCDIDRPSHHGVFLLRNLCERRYAGRVLIISDGGDPAIEPVLRLARQSGLSVLGVLRKPLRLDDVRRLLAGEAVAAQAEPPAMPSLLEAAISQGGLHPFFQPKVRMDDARISGAEALARIATQQATLASPGPYVALAERNSRIDALTFAMTCAVARHAAAFALDGRPLPVSINISPVSLARDDFPEMMSGAVESQGLSCDLVTLELTDNRPDPYDAKAHDVMLRLRGKGFGLSIDDFGAGQANLDRLGLHPFSEVKIDPSLIRLALDETFARACLASSIRHAHDLGLNVVGEGVETTAMWDLLGELGADEAQGFLISRPMPPRDLARLVSAGGALARACA